jgi:hypothetical protein
MVSWFPMPVPEKTGLLGSRMTDAEPALAKSVRNNPQADSLGSKFGRKNNIRPP